MTQFSDFLTAQFGDQCRAISAGVLLSTLPIVFSISSFHWTRRKIIAFSELIAQIIPGTPTCTRVISAVKVADHHLPGDRKCLIRSSTAEALLLIYGFNPDHRIGVAREDHGEISAHSWIEIDDDVLIGKLDDLERFSPLPSLYLDEVE
jgi:hypothetical protein